MFCPECAGTIAGVSSSGFTDKCYVSAFFHIYCETFGGRAGESAGQQIDFPFISICFGLHYLLPADAMRLLFPDKIFTNIPSVAAVASSVLADVYNEIGKVFYLRIGCFEIFQHGGHHGVDGQIADAVLQNFGFYGYLFFIREVVSSFQG